MSKTQVVLNSDQIALLDLAIKSASEINVYWNIYIAVATFVVGAIFAGEKYTNSKTIQSIMVIGFSVFAVSNYLAISRLADLRVALIEILPPELQDNEALKQSLMPNEWYEYLVFHLLLDLVVIALIVVVPWRRRNASGSETDQEPAAK